MKVILLEPMAKLGTVGDEVTVKRGYAVNYLIPEGKALQSTATNIIYFQERKAEIEKQNQELKAKAAKLNSDMNGTTITLIHQASDEGRLFGSISAREIASQLTAMNFDVSYKQVDLFPIRNIGIYDVTIKLHAEIKAIIRVNVARSEGEAKEALENLKKAKEKAEEAAKKKAEEQAMIDAISQKKPETSSSGTAA